MTVSELFYPHSATVLAPVASHALTDDTKACPRSWTLPSVDCVFGGESGSVRSAAINTRTPTSEKGDLVAADGCVRSAAVNTNTLISVVKGQESLQSISVHYPRRNITAGASCDTLINTQMRSSNDQVFAVSFNEKTLLSLSKVRGSRPAVLTVGGTQFSVYRITAKSCGKSNWFNLVKELTCSKLYRCTSGYLAKGAVFSFDASDVNGLSALLLSANMEHVGPLCSSRLLDPLADLRVVLDAAAVQLARHEALVCARPKPDDLADTSDAGDSQVVPCERSRAPWTSKCGFASYDDAIDFATAAVATLKLTKACPSNYIQARAMVAEPSKPKNAGRVRELWPLLQGVLDEVISRPIITLASMINPLTDMMLDPCRGYAGNTVFLDAMRKLWNFLSGLCHNPGFVDAVVAAAAAAAAASAARRFVTAPIQQGTHFASTLCYRSSLSARFPM